MSDAERIAGLERDVRDLNRAGMLTAKAGLTVTHLGQQLERTVAINSEAIASFERTIADMQTQIDELKAAADDR